ncbi:MAG: site-specific DNA-methyltransferase, partial [Candidatus Limnocylindria bacterium]
FHSVINAENYHALQALLYTDRGKVDAIYIDPPYNTGARDWKYNNDYVEGDDMYRHSKWLAFMERRLLLAKELLNPDDSVLIVTIDEKEYLRLGLLLEQTFAGARIQMVTSVINTKGVARSREFARVEEYLYFVMVGNAGPAASLANMLLEVDPEQTEQLWSSLLRRGTGAKRADRPNQFYPIFVSEENRTIVGVGSPLLPLSAERDQVEAPDGSVCVWPLRTDGSEGRWQLGRDALIRSLSDGTARLGSKNLQRNQWAVNYLTEGVKKRIATGEVKVRGTDSKGALQLEPALAAERDRTARTVWNRPSHDASTYGTSLLRAFAPGAYFPFPKSLYAVEDTIRFFVKDKPNAVILDFFAGSGTTAHAVARLNRQDGGRRQSIMVTNNEVSVDEAAELRRQGFRPGDPEWEALGIFQHITRPRVTAAITGRTPDGEPIKGDYKFTDEFPMADGFEENVAFFDLRYLDADDVDLGHAYDDLAALLWLRAGAQGRVAARVDADGQPLPFDWTERYGVLFDEDRWRAFVAARPETATAAFIVTYSPTVFAGITAELPASVETVRLYDTYLSLFRPDRVRS